MTSAPVRSFDDAFARPVGKPRVCALGLSLALVAPFWIAVGAIAIFWF
jgi:hypothetical protein